jgi:hypothetical protein
MTTKQTQRRIASLKNKLERATTRPDPTGTICETLRRAIARLEGKAAQ